MRGPLFIVSLVYSVFLFYIAFKCAVVKANNINGRGLFMCIPNAENDAALK